MAVTIKLESYSSEIEIRHLLYTLAQIKRGFYQKQDFLLLSSTPHPGFEKDVYLHPATIASLKNLNWKNFNQDIWFSNYLTSSLPKLNLELPSVSYQLIKSRDWTSRNRANPGIKHITPINITALKKAVLIITNLFDLKALTIHIHPVINGTKTSFTKLYENKIHIFIRTDATSKNILRAVIGAIVRSLHPNINWSEYQSFQNFLCTKTKIANLIKQHKEPVMSSKNHHLLLTESNDNYHKLGFPNKLPLNLKSNGQIFLDNYGIIDFLSAKELVILQQLLKHQNKIVTYDQIGDLLWPDSPEKYSLQAISKIVERIRHQLHLAGLHQPLILTIPKHGYQVESRT